MMTRMRMGFKLYNSIFNIKNSKLVPHLLLNLES